MSGPLPSTPTLLADLTPISTTYTRQSLNDIQISRRSNSPKSHSIIYTQQDAFNILQSQPAYDQLLSVLQYIHIEHADFGIQRPSRESARIVSVLISEIAERYWQVLKNDKGYDNPPAQMFLECLLSITGLNAIITKLRALCSKTDGHTNSFRAVPVDTTSLALYLDILSSLLQADDLLGRLWDNISSKGRASEPIKKQLLGDIQRLLAGGKLLSVAAEAEHTYQAREGREKSWWVADGTQFTKWLGTGLASWAKRGAEETRLAGAMWSKGLRLGYAGESRHIEPFLDRRYLTKTQTHSRRRSLTACCCESPMALPIVSLD